MMTDGTKEPGIDPMSLEPEFGTRYPAPFAKDCEGRERRRVGNAFGLTHYGVNIVKLPAGGMSSQRHWHSHQDEFVYIIAGEATLVTDSGEQVLRPGMVAGFPAGKADGHHLVNKSGTAVVYMEVGDRPPVDDVDYPDIDMLLRDGRFVRKDGTPY